MQEALRERAHLCADEIKELVLTPSHTETHTHTLSVTLTHTHTHSHSHTHLPGIQTDSRPGFCHKEYTNFILARILQNHLLSIYILLLVEFRL